MAPKPIQKYSFNAYIPKNADKRNQICMAVVRCMTYGPHVTYAAHFKEPDGTVWQTSNITVFNISRHLQERQGWKLKCFLVLAR